MMPSLPAVVPGFQLPIDHCRGWQRRKIHKCPAFVYLRAETCTTAAPLVWPQQPMQQERVWRAAGDSKLSAQALTWS